MDLNQASHILQQLSDQQLQQEFQRPSPGIPQFLILTELQRRKAMRAEQTKPVDTTPVSQELLQSGVAATPQMAQGSAPVSMAQGGIVGYAGGGALDDLDNWAGNIQQRVGDYYDSIEPLRAQNRGNTYLPPAPNIMQPPQMQPQPQPMQRPDMPPPPAPVRPAPMPTNPMKQKLYQAIFSQESGNRDSVGMSVNGARGPGQITPETWKQYAKPGESIDNPADNRAVSMRIVDDLWDKSGGDPAKVAAGYFSGPKNMGDGDTPFKRDVADGNGTTTSQYVQGVISRMFGGVGGIQRPQLEKVPAMQYMGMPGRTPVEQTPVPDMPPPVDVPKEVTPEDRLAAVKEANPDMTGPEMERLKQRVEANQGDKKDAVNYALITAGLGMMASKSPNFMQAIGEGGIPAVHELSKEMKDIKRTDLALVEAQNKVDEKRQEAARGIYKMAQDQSEKANTYNSSMFGHKIYDRRFEISDRDRIMQNNTNERNAAARNDTNMQLGVMQFNKGAANIDRQGIRDENANQVRMYQTDANNDTKQQLGAANAVIKGYGMEEKAKGDALKEYNSLKDEYIKSKSMLPDFSMKQGQIAQEAHKYAMSRLSPDSRSRLNFVDQPDAGPAVIKMNSNGSFNK